ncbi:hypothetical protein C8R44DRAFT_725153 [Mycena epipterygia]|nr:hypothetical protein C8R44DRAFT_725153 [Mycena epipterygia]
MRIRSWKSSLQCVSNETKVAWRIGYPLIAQHLAYQLHTAALRRTGFVAHRSLCVSKCNNRCKNVEEDSEEQNKARGEVCTPGSVTGSSAAHRYSAARRIRGFVSAPGDSSQGKPKPHTEATRCSGPLERIQFIVTCQVLATGESTIKSQPNDASANRLIDTLQTLRAQGPFSVPRAFRTGGNAFRQPIMSVYLGALEFRASNASRFRRLRWGAFVRAPSPQYAARSFSVPDEGKTPLRYSMRHEGRGGGGVILYSRGPQTEQRVYEKQTCSTVGVVIRPEFYKMPTEHKIIPGGQYYKMLAICGLAGHEWQDIWIKPCINPQIPPVHKCCHACNNHKYSSTSEEAELMIVRLISEETVMGVQPKGRISRRFTSKEANPIDGRCSEETVPK